VSSKLWAIVKREYIERVRSKAFVIGTILGPLLMAAMIVVPTLAARSKGKALRLAVVDAKGDLGPAVEAALAEQKSDGRARFQVVPAKEVGATEADFKQAVIEQRLDGYLALPADVVETANASYYGRNVSNFSDLRSIENTAGGVLVSRRLEAAGLDASRVKSLTRELDMKKIRLSETGEREDRGAAMFLALILLMILYISILVWGQAVLSSVIEEKTSRVVEVMAASVPSTTLLLGKLVGVGAAGLTQFLVWAGSLFLVSLASAGAISGLALPEITPLMLVSFVVFYLLGYFFYSALYAAIGSSVGTLRDVQALVLPVMPRRATALSGVPDVMAAPDGALAVTTSMIPGMSPLIMFLRIVILQPPMWQILLSMALLVLGILAVVWFAARVYRVGILMYGKRPTFPEILRWVRHS
jgi:ABC-2 type transport system permease protein